MVAVGHGRTVNSRSPAHDSWPVACELSRLMTGSNILLTFLARHRTWAIRTTASVGQQTGTPDPLEALNTLLQSSQPSRGRMGGEGLHRRDARVPA